MSEATSPYTIVICINRRYCMSSPSCAARGGLELAEQLERELRAAGLAIGVKRLQCLGQCERGPNLRIAPGGRFFHEMSMAQIPQVIAELQRLLEEPAW